MESQEIKESVTQERLLLTSRVRWLVGFMLLFLTVLNYADRGVLGVVATKLEAALHLSVAQYGIVASAFGWAYVPFLFIGGWLILKIGSRRLYFVSVAAWSLFIILTPLAGSFGILLFVRILFGASEGSIFPNGTAMIESWFPMKEHGLASTLLIAGIPLGTLLITPVALFMTDRFGWHSPFYLLGAVGALWVIIAYIVLHDNPWLSPFVSKKMVTSGAAKAYQGSMRAEHVSWSKIVGNLQLWGVGWSFFTSAYLLYFMLAFFPSYLKKERHIAFSHLPLAASLPWMAMTVGAVIAGPLSDLIMKKSGGNRRLARGVLAGVCLVVVGMLVFASLGVTSTGGILLLIALATGINFIANPLFIAMPLDIGGRWAGQAAGFSTALASCAGVAAPLVTGFIVSTTGSYTAAFVVVGLLVISGGVVSLFIKGNTIDQELSRA
jgi:ACS family hexuronate transporter-like MFS transporter